MPKYKFVFFGSDERENNCWVVEKCACAPKMFWIILEVNTYIFGFLKLPEQG